MKQFIGRKYNEKITNMDITGFGCDFDKRLQRTKQ